MTEGILGIDIDMGWDVFEDTEFLEKVKGICVNNNINKIRKKDIKEFLETVKTILIHNPNEFVTLKDLANNAAIKEILQNKWNLRSDPDHAVMWFLCCPMLFLSPPDKRCLECRDHADYAQWALKYNPDIQIYPEIDDNWEDASELKEIEQQDKKRDQHRGQVTYPALFNFRLEEMVQLFPDLKREEQFKEVDKILDDLDKVLADFDEYQIETLAEHLEEHRKSDSKREDFIQNMYNPTYWYFRRLREDLELQAFIGVRLSTTQDNK